MYQFVKEADKVLIFSDKSFVYFGDIKAEIEKSEGKKPEILFENLEILLKTNPSFSSIDVILAAFEQPFVLNNVVLKKLLQFLKPKGIIIFRGAVEELKNLEASFVSRLKLNGFLCETSQTVSTKTSDDSEKIFNEINAKKPSYETGSSVSLSFAKNSVNMWKLNDEDDDDDNDANLIDENDLLDESETKKPLESSLRVCSTTGKRKACKDCTCGLSEELNGKNEDQSVKSSCGNCYLGDAFRCASCPYLGMAAFKPGEKIILDDSQLVNI